MLTLRKYRVLELAEKAGFQTQEELANAVGISHNWMSALINGRAMPSTEQLVRLAQLLGSSIDEIAEYPKAEAPDAVMIVAM